MGNRMTPVSATPLPRPTLGERLQHLCDQRQSSAAAVLMQFNEHAGHPGAAFGGFTRRGAHYDYQKKSVFVSRQLLALGSPELLRFILAHEVGHATQRKAKQYAIAWEQVGVIGLALWVLGAHAYAMPGWANSPTAFVTCLSGFYVGLRALDIWWEIDADKKARQLTGYRGKMAAIFDEFLAIETVHKPNFQAKVRTFIADFGR